MKTCWSSQSSHASPDLGFRSALKAYASWGSIWHICASRWARLCVDSWFPGQVADPVDGPDRLKTTPVFEDARGVSKRIFSASNLHERLNFHLLLSSLLCMCSFWLEEPARPETTGKKKHMWIYIHPFFFQFLLCVFKYLHREKDAARLLDEAMQKLDKRDQSVEKAARMSQQYGVFDERWL